MKKTFIVADDDCEQQNDVTFNRRTRWSRDYYALKRGNPLIVCESQQADTDREINGEKLRRKRSPHCDVWSDEPSEALYERMDQESDWSCPVGQMQQEEVKYQYDYIDEDLKCNEKLPERPEEIKGYQFVQQIDSNTPLDFVEFQRQMEFPNGISGKQIEQLGTPLLSSFEDLDEDPDTFFNRLMKKRKDDSQKGYTKIVMFK